MDGLPGGDGDRALDRGSQRLLALVIDQLPPQHDSGRRRTGIGGMRGDVHRGARFQEVAVCLVAFQLCAGGEHLDRPPWHIVRRPLGLLVHHHAIDGDRNAPSDLQQVMRLRPEAVLRHIGGHAHHHPLPGGSDGNRPGRLIGPQAAMAAAHLACAGRDLHQHLSGSVALHPEAGGDRLAALDREGRAHHHLALDMQCLRTIAHRIAHQGVHGRLDVVPVEQAAFEGAVADEVLGRPSAAEECHQHEEDDGLAAHGRSPGVGVGNRAGRRERRMIP